MRPISGEQYMRRENSQPVAGADDNLLAAVAGILPSLPNLRAEDADRFAQAVRAIVEKRAQEGWPNEKETEDVSVFVFVERPREFAAKHETRPFLDLIATDKPLLGHLFFASRDASNGQAMKMPVADTQAILDWINDQGLARHPIVITYRASKTLITRRAGVENGARRDIIRDKAPTTSVEELLEVLDAFHRTDVLTPSCPCASGIWEPDRESQYIPGPHPETCIQKELVKAMNHRFSGRLRAEAEDKTNIGRIDVRLLRSGQNGGPLAYWAIIELKVLKSFANAAKGCDPSKVEDTKNIDAIAEGIRQAWAFRENREADEGLLEIFDLRKNKTKNLLSHNKIVEVMAKCTPVPTHNIRPLFGTAGDARRAGFTGV